MLFPLTPRKFLRVEKIIGTRLYLFYVFESVKFSKDFLLNAGMNSQTSTINSLETLGSRQLSAELVPVVYDELRRLADIYLRNERSNHTLQPTALVHEAYLRLIELENIKWQNREHIIGMVAIIMRRVLVNYAVNRKRDKRGGGDLTLTLSEADRLIKDEDVNLIALDESLEKLSKDYPQASSIVELRFFGGLSIAETAKILKVSDSTVERDWRFARAWLRRELGER